jgi:D-alanine-D-alanine ligase
MTGRIVVLHNAVGADADLDARDVLVQVEEVSAALATLGYTPEPLAVTLDLDATRATLRRMRPALVFNLVEDVGGHAEMIAAVPMLLEALRVPFTGAPAHAMFLTQSKPLAKGWLEYHDLPTPSWLEGENDPPAGRHGPTDRFGGQWIVKPVWEDASVGLDDAAVVTDLDAARERLVACRARGGAWFAERFIDGREINVALLADGASVTVLPVAEIRFVDFPAGKPRIVGYDAKWRENSFEYSHTPRDFALGRAEPALSERIADLASGCWRAFGLRGYARVDLRVDAHGEPWILEVNANPCLSSDAGFAAALIEAGIPFERAIERIVTAATGVTR